MSYDQDPAEPTMNAEQLARDIESLPEAHRILTNMGAIEGPIGKRVESVKDTITIERCQATHKELSRVPCLQSASSLLDDRVRALVDELLKLRKDTATLDRVCHESFLGRVAAAIAAAKEAK